MGQRGSIRLRRLVHVLVLALSVGLASAPAAPSDATSRFEVLQMNLCNSGWPALPCYAGGKAVDEAADKIRRYAPDLVALQEICRDDVYAGSGWGPLARAMERVHGSGNISVRFAPAWNRYADEPYRCINGEQFGVALIHHGDGVDIHSGLYSAQDGSDEMRTWVCATLVRERLTGCTTHLSTHPAVALRQCRELIATLASPWVAPKVVLVGDLHLRAEHDGPYDVSGCAPSRYERRGDSSVQHIFFTRNLLWVRGTEEKLRWTDHPLLSARFLP